MSEHSSEKNFSRAGLHSQRTATQRLAGLRRRPQRILAEVAARSVLFEDTVELLGVRHGEVGPGPLLVVEALLAVDASLPDRLRSAVDQPLELRRVALRAIRQ